MHAEHHLAADPERRVEQEIERAPDRALGRVLHRHDGVLRRAGLDLAEYLVDRAERCSLDRPAEMLADRLWLKVPSGPR